MFQFFFQRYPRLYFPLMLVITRMMGSLGGLITIYYVHLTISQYPRGFVEGFTRVAAGTILLAIVATSVLSLLLSRNLRRSLSRLDDFHSLPPQLATAAVREATLFVQRQLRHEFWLVPMVTTVPACAYVALAFPVLASFVFHIAIATLLGIALSLLVMYYAIECGMRPIQARLLARVDGSVIEGLPIQRLQLKINIGFGIIIICTATMIGSLAYRRSADILQSRGHAFAAVDSLRDQTLAISIAALFIGIIFSRVLGTSIAGRVAVLSAAIRRVQAGELSRRVDAAGNDEIDVLARQFNSMVANLEYKDRTVRDLNANLESKVVQRTAELQCSEQTLSESLSTLQRMHTDLAEKKDRLEQTIHELRVTQDRLVQSEKMSSLGQLAAGLAHEINNSINAVSNGIPGIIARTERLERLVASLVETNAGDDPAIRDDIGRTFATIKKLAGVVEEGADRTVRIVGDMKTFSHPGASSHEVFDVHRVLDLCVGLADKQRADTVAIQRDYCGAGVIRGPFGQLNQVFMNLLNNAQQAMPHGGAIYLTTQRDGGFLQVSIRDTGTGIPEAIRSRVFDPFFTTKAPGQGTGLGLSISYGIINRLGGTIECHSVEGVGTEFIIRLPALADDAPSAAAVPLREAVLATA